MFVFAIFNTKMMHFSVGQNNVYVNLITSVPKYLLTLHSIQMYLFKSLCEILLNINYDYKRL